MVELKKVGVLSVAKIYTVLMAIGGLIVGIIFLIFQTILRALPSEAAQVGQENIPTLGGIWIFLTIIIFPILYAAIGFVTGAIGALLYNLVAKWIGGIEMDFKKY